MGKCFAKIWHSNNVLLDKTQWLITEAKRKDLELNQKRNLVIYLYELVNSYAHESSDMREKYFVEIQKTFMRYLFDRRGFM